MSVILILMVILLVALACTFKLLDWLIRRNFESLPADGDPGSK